MICPKCLVDENEMEYPYIYCSRCGLALGELEK